MFFPRLHPFTTDPSAVRYCVVPLLRCRLTDWCYIQLCPPTAKSDVRPPVDCRRRVLHISSPPQGTLVAGRYLAALARYPTGTVRSHLRCGDLLFRSFPHFYIRYSTRGYNRYGIETGGLRLMTRIDPARCGRWYSSEQKKENCSRSSVPINVVTRS